MIAKVVVDLTSKLADRIFDYEFEDDGKYQTGMRVSVPFAGQNVVGYIVGFSSESTFSGNLKSVNERLDDYPVISPELFSLGKYMEKRYDLKSIDVYRLFYPHSMRVANIKDKEQSFLTLNDECNIDEYVLTVPKRKKNKLKALYEFMDGDLSRSKANALFGKANIDELIDEGVLDITTRIIRSKPYKKIVGEDKGVVLNKEQRNALESVLNTDKTVSLIHGVTGSGKTEIYLELIEKTLENGKNVIVLVPEIALTAELISRFRGRFNDLVAIQHSGLSVRERYDEWRLLQTGEARIAVGARSAIFAPMNNIGLIIIDEEHDSSYYSESNPRYYTIDVAKERARLSRAKVVLGSATPSIESYSLAQKGDYNLIKIQNRFNNIKMPVIETVDMSRELAAGNNGILSRRLVAAISERLDKNEQTMIFLNRRGYSSFLMCRECGYIATCQDCEIPLTYHKEDDMLKCHYCNRRYAMPPRCVKCGSEKIKSGKIGTERVVEEIKKLFPNSKILRLDNDVTERKDALIDVLTSFKNRQADILVGTQMIAKGHNFPYCTLVGILEADSGLYHSDYQSTERTFQLVTQVAGRAGRDKIAGEVILQTYTPNHYVFRFATENDYEGFFRKESNLRETTGFPPYSVILRLLLSSEDEIKCVDVTKKLYDLTKEYYLNNKDKFNYFAAMKSPVHRLKKLYRYQILFRIKNQYLEEVSQTVFAIKNRIEKETKEVQIFSELNPQNMI